MTKGPHVCVRIRPVLHTPDTPDRSSTRTPSFTHQRRKAVSCPVCIAQWSKLFSMAS